MRDCDTMLRLELSLAWTTEAPETDAPLPSRAERGTWEGRTARRREAPSTGRGWASVLRCSAPVAGFVALVCWTAPGRTLPLDPGGCRGGDGGQAGALALADETATV
ncbi:hypothetical protein [Sorangium cellulosum]|uniref:hypothetical protein n=1 Tax=Sorangium cellulosum TaxID=56 RepID=UPI0005D2B16A|nr:hypothetical protein [Sorangium cellulosum]